jgi:hypothetical protein
LLAALRVFLRFAILLEGFQGPLMEGLGYIATITLRWMTAKAEIWEEVLLLVVWYVWFLRNEAIDISV